MVRYAVLHKYKCYQLKHETRQILIAICAAHAIAYNLDKSIVHISWFLVLKRGLNAA